MTTRQLPKDNPILNQATELVKYIYDEVLDLFGEFDMEKYDTESKIRRSANDVMFFVAQAAGSRAIETSKYDWNNARKNLVALRAMYIFSDKRFFELEPSIVVKMDKLIAEIDKEIDKSENENKRKIDEDLEPWRKKYNIWKKISEDDLK